MSGGDQLNKQWTLKSQAHLLSKAEKQGPSALFNCLRNRRLWNSTEIQIQDLAIKAVAKQLGDFYQWVSTRTYECAGQATRIATFRFRIDMSVVDHKEAGVLQRVFDKSPPLQVELNLIPGGRYKIGSKRSIPIAPFLMGRAPIIQRAWDLFEPGDQRRIDNPELAIHGLSWEDADLWLVRAGQGLRLPSEAEWEYACRAGTTGDFYWGPSLNKDHCWMADNSDERPQVSQAHRDKVNAFGLQDTLGQLWEWCWDVYYDDASEGALDERARGDIRGLTSKDRVLRGGCYASSASDLSASMRRKAPQILRDKTVGLRLARTLNLY
jgi:hypothetical protein